MPTYLFRSKSGREIEEVHPITNIPDSVKVRGTEYKRVPAITQGFQMPVESSPRYQKWFHSESTQAKLKSGEYEILSKSADANQ